MTPEQARFLAATTSQGIQKEWEITRKVLSAAPEGRLDYQPDPKARTAIELCRHIVMCEVWFLESVVKGEFSMEEAHRPEDILNVLALAEEFSLKLVLVGASGGHLVADAIADAGVPVIVGQTVGTARFQNNQYRYHVPDHAARLQAAGVEVYVAAGADPAHTKALVLNTAAAVGHRFEPDGADAALARITHGVAKLLGVDDRVGRVAPGAEADLVIWDGHPFSPASRVEKVLIGGSVVYDASRHGRWARNP